MTREEWNATDAELGEVAERADRTSVHSVALEDVASVLSALVALGWRVERPSAVVDSGLVFALGESPAERDLADWTADLARPDHDDHVDARALGAWLRSRECRLYAWVQGGTLPKLLREHAEYAVLVAHTGDAPREVEVRHAELAEAVRLALVGYDAEAMKERRAK